MNGNTITEPRGWSRWFRRGPWEGGATVLIVASLRTPAPSHEQLAGLTFATVEQKVDTVPVQAAGRRFRLARETVREQRLNIAFSLLLIATVVGLWIHFR